MDLKTAGRAETASLEKARRFAYGDGRTLKDTEYPLRIRRFLLVYLLVVGSILSGLANRLGWLDVQHTIAFFARCC